MLCEHHLNQMPEHSRNLLLGTHSRGRFVFLATAMVVTGVHVAMVHIGCLHVLFGEVFVLFTSFAHFLNSSFVFLLLKYESSS